MSHSCSKYHRDWIRGSVVDCGIFMRIMQGYVHVYRCLSSKHLQIEPWSIMMVPLGDNHCLSTVPLRSACCRGCAVRVWSPLHWFWAKLWDSGSGQWPGVISTCWDRFSSSFGIMGITNGRTICPYRKTENAVVDDTADVQWLMTQLVHLHPAASGAVMTSAYHPSCGHP